MSLTHDYTVTISGPERDEGHSPWTYVVTAQDLNTAQEYALHAHISGRPWQHLLGLRIEDVASGEPPANCGYYWNDLRPKKEVPNES